MGETKDKPILSFKTRKDQVTAVFSVSVLAAIITGVVKCFIVLWEVFSIAGSFATTKQISDTDAAVRSYCESIVAAEREERKAADADFKIDMRDIRNKCLRGFGGQ